MKHFLLLAMTALVLIPAAPATAQNLAVLELFTAQGCFTAPAGDAAFEQTLEHHTGNLIAFSCHTTFFDGNGDPDQFSRSFCNDRHERYYTRLDLWNLETPQFMINGYYDIALADTETIESGIVMAQSLNSVKPVSLDLKKNTLTINLPELDELEHDGYEILLIGFKNEEKVTIKGGPNDGRTVNYIKPVLSMKELEKNWQGKGKTITHTVKPAENTDGYIVIIEERKGMHIRGAGQIELPKAIPKPS